MTAYGHKESCECNLCENSEVTKHRESTSSEAEVEAAEDLASLRETELEQLQEKENAREKELEQLREKAALQERELEQLRERERLLQATRTTEEPADENDYPNPPLPKG